MKGINVRKVKDIRNAGNDYTQSMYLGSQEEFVQLGRNTVVATAITLAGTTYYPVNQLTNFRVWVATKGAAYVGGDTLTFKFYKEIAFGDAPSGKIYSEIETTAAITCDTAAVADGKCDFVAVPDDTDIIKSASHFTVSGSITVPALGWCVASLGKSAVV